MFFVQKSYLSRLEEIRDTLETSPFFKAHEVKTHPRRTNPKEKNAIFYVLDTSMKENHPSESRVYVLIRWNRTGFELWI